MNHFRAALLAGFVLCMSVDAVFGQDIPTVSVSIPEVGQNGGPSNGAQRVAPNVLLLRERQHTLFFIDNGFQSGSVRIQRSGATTLSPMTINYSLRYYYVSNGVVQGANQLVLQSMPNVGIINDIWGLPAPIANPCNSNSVPDSYFPASTPVSRNGLQGDLSPVRQTASGAFISVINVTTSGNLSWANNVTEEFAFFRARWSDQIYPRNPQRQGLRVAIFALLPSPAYHIASGSDSAFVFLDDPRPMLGMIPDNVQNISVEQNVTSAVTRSLDVGDICLNEVRNPKGIFFQTTYNGLIYSAVSADTNIVRVRMEQPIPRRVTQNSLLTYTIAPNTPVNTAIRITITATDTSRQSPFSWSVPIASTPTSKTELSAKIHSSTTATAEFFIRIVPMRTSSVSQAISAQNLIVSPNPVEEVCRIHLVPFESGLVLIRLRDVLGNTLFSTSIEGTRGREYSHTIDMTGFASGTYFVEVNDGKATSTKKIVKM